MAKHSGDEVSVTWKWLAVTAVGALIAIPAIAFSLLWTVHQDTVSSLQSHIEQGAHKEAHVRLEMLTETSKAQASAMKAIEARLLEIRDATRDNTAELKLIARRKDKE